MEGNNRRKQGLFFGIVGILTLIVAVIGATFAYFTATETVEDQISGNAASINFSLTVAKAVNTDVSNGGLIPMTNGMVEAAVSNASGNGVCVDNNNNAVCQIYRITVANSGTAGMFLDGFVNLTGGAPNGPSQNPTNMRWAQVFVSGSAYSVNGTPALASGATNLNSISLSKTGTSNTNLVSTQTTANYTLSGNSYLYISNNYMRTSGKGTGKYTRSDVNNSLVFNQYLAPAADATNATRDLYIVVWLMETGTNQNLSSTNQFFSGSVTFNSAQGGEVSAVFGGFTRVSPDTVS